MILQSGNNTYLLSLLSDDSIEKKFYNHFVSMAIEHKASQHLTFFSILSSDNSVKR